MYLKYFKYKIDFFAALVLAVIVAPVIIVVAIVLYFNLKSNPFFTQKRPGKNEKLFKIIKFKTMTDERDENGDLLSDEARLTKLGFWIRKTSLDELPQLLNILKGELSFIGPRPLLEEYLPLYNAEQRIRHAVRPGISGWAQINGRNSISWKEKFKLDIYYVENHSFKLDLKILIKTFYTVIKRENISSKTSVTTEKFTGNN